MVVRPKLWGCAGFADAGKAAGQDAGSGFSIEGEGPEDDGAAADGTALEGWDEAWGDVFLDDEVPGAALDEGEPVFFCGGGEGCPFEGEQFVFSEGGDEDVAVEVGEHSLAHSYLAKPPAFDEGEEEFLAKPLLADAWEEGLEGCGAGKAGARGVHDGYVTGAPGFDEAGDAAAGGGPELEGIDSVFIEAADDSIDSAEAAEGFEKQSSLADGEIGRFDEGDAEQACFVGVLKVGWVAVAGG